MNWIAIGLGAASGVLAGLIAALLVRRPSDRRGAYTIVFAVTFLILNSLARELVLPEFNARRTSEEAESALQEIPVYRLIKTYEPQAYQQLVDTLAKGLQDGAALPQLILDVSDRLQPIILKRLPVASNDAVVSYTHATVQVLEGLDSDQCYDFLFQAQYTASARTNVVDELWRSSARNKILGGELLSSMAEVVKTSAENPQPTPTEDDVGEDLDSIIMDLYEVYGDDVFLLDNLHDPQVDKGKLCALVAGLYKRILRLPKEQSGRMLRYLYSQG